MAIRIYLVYDDADLRQVLVNCLEQEGWQVTALDSNSHPTLRVNDHPDLWILDADGREGFNLIRTVKKDLGSTPVILTSEQERVMDRVLGLELGCEDYLIKPFSSREIVLRARRILEGNEKNNTYALTNLIRLQNYYLDLSRRMAVYEGQYICLTAKEFNLLYFLSEHKGMTLSREQILRFIWGDDYFGSDRVVDDMIRRTRKKMKHLKIETLYGYGYRVI